MRRSLIPSFLLAAAAAAPAAGGAAPGPSEAWAYAAAQGGGGTTPPTSKIFNPDIAVVGDFIAAVGEGRDDAEPALELHEVEVSLQAVVDPYARADFFIIVSPDEVGVEEGFVTFTTLPAGFLVKAGKLRDAFGKVNAMHNHVLPWADRPLVTRNLLGGEDGLADAGISVARIFPNSWLFLEATGQVYRGESAIFHAETRGDLAYVGHLRGYRDLSESSNLDLGASAAYGHNDLGSEFSTRLLGFDATYRWRPLRRAIYRRFIARTELVWSRREQLDATPASFGTYAAADYQFARRWYAGVRGDWSERADTSAVRDRGAAATLTYWPSEFSQIRAQFRHTEYGDGPVANELLVQLLFSIGAHGAHAF